jgi:hypothetical protein
MGDVGNTMVQTVEVGTAVHGKENGDKVLLAVPSVSLLLIAILLQVGHPVIILISISGRNR